MLDALAKLELSFDSLIMYDNPSMYTTAVWKAELNLPIYFGPFLQEILGICSWRVREILSSGNMTNFFQLLMAIFRKMLRIYSWTSTYKLYQLVIWKCSFLAVEGRKSRSKTCSLSGWRPLCKSLFLSLSIQTENLVT